MSKKSFELSKDDPIVQQFSSGLEAWERPFEARGCVKTIRTRGAVKTRGAVRTRGPAMVPTFALPEDDPLVEQFRNGLESWEGPFERKR